MTVELMTIDYQFEMCSNLSGYFDLTFYFRSCTALIKDLLGMGNDGVFIEAFFLSDFLLLKSSSRNIMNQLFQLRL